MVSQVPGPFDEFNTKLLAAYKRSERFPDEHICPRGQESGCQGRACWQVDQGCSYCGSLHPDILMERLEDATIKITPTDKSYKIYVCNDAGQPFSQSFREDGSPSGNDPSKWEWTTREIEQTKFYFQHLLVPQRKRFVELINQQKIKFNEPGYFYVLPFFIQR